MASRPHLTNALTIDVEDYFQVSAMAPYIDRADWDKAECRVEHNIDRILQLLDAKQTRATFFTLGWVAERYPALVKRIVDVHGGSIKVASKPGEGTEMTITFARAKGEPDASHTHR